MPRLVLFLAILLAACVSAEQVQVRFDSITVSAELADSPEEWQLGLMNRKSLAENKGMLFAFSDEARRSFWMKNTLMPLDVIFISANLTVVDVQTMEPCSEEPCRLYPSAAPAKYALEVNKGFAKKHDIAAGDKVEITF